MAVIQFTGGPMGGSEMSDLTDKALDQTKATVDKGSLALATAITDILVETDVDGVDRKYVYAVDAESGKKVKYRIMGIFVGYI